MLQALVRMGIVEGDGEAVKMGGPLNCVEVRS